MKSNKQKSRVIITTIIVIAIVCVAFIYNANTRIVKVEGMSIDNIPPARTNAVVNSLPFLPDRVTDAIQTAVDEIIPTLSEEYGVDISYIVNYNEDLCAYIFYVNADGMADQIRAIWGGNSDIIEDWNNLRDAQSFLTKSFCDEVGGITPEGTRWVAMVLNDEDPTKSLLTTINGDVVYDITQPK